MPPQFNLLEALGIIVVGIIFGLLASRAKLRRWEGVSLLIILYGIFAVIANIWIGITFLFRPPVPPPTPVPPPSATAPPPPTRTPFPFTVQAAPSCLLWSEITSAMAGRQICAHGVVLDHKEDWENRLTTLYFGTREQFFFVSTYRWSESLEGRCIEANGEVQLNTYKVPYIKIDDFRVC